MNRHERGLEFKVGIFVFLGLSMVAALVVEFGRVGEGFKAYYPVTVRFTDASGLLKGSDVLLAGAKIGRVAGGPRLAREGPGVLVPLRIYDYVKIPLGSKFTVGSSGLLGDRFVTVTLPRAKPTAYVKKNAMVEGTRETGIDDLTREGGKLVGDLRGTVENIDQTVTRLNQEALSPANIKDLRSTMEHLNETTKALAQSSKKLDGVVDQAGAAMGSIKGDADDLQSVVADARKTVQSATQVFQEAMKGNGLLAALLTDQRLAADFRALVSNLRAHGVLFYRDTAAQIEMNAHPQQHSRSRSKQR